MVFYTYTFIYWPTMPKVPNCYLSELFKPSRKLRAIQMKERSGGTSYRQQIWKAKIHCKLLLQLLLLHSHSICILWWGSEKNFFFPFHFSTYTTHSSVVSKVSSMNLMQELVLEEDS